MVVSQLVQVFFKGVDAGVNRTLDAISTKGDKANKPLLSIDRMLKAGFGVLAAEKTLRIMSKLADETFRAAGMTEQWDKATKGIKEGFFEGLATGLGDTLKEIIILLENSAPTVREWGVAIGEGINFAIDTARELYNWLAEIIGLQRATFGLSKDEAALRVGEIDKQLERLERRRRELAGSGVPEAGLFIDADMKEAGRLAEERATLVDLQRKYAELETRANSTKVAQVSGADQATKALAKQEAQTRKLADAERRRAEQYSAASGLQRGLNDVLEKWRRIGDATRENVVAMGNALEGGLTNFFVDAANEINNLDKVWKNFVKGFLRDLQAIASRQLASSALNLVVGAFFPGAGAAGGAAAGAGGGAGPSMMGFGGGRGGGGGGTTVVHVHNHVDLSKKIGAALVENQDVVVGLAGAHLSSNRGGFRTAVKNAARR